MKVVLNKHNNKKTKMTRNFYVKNFNGKKTYDPSSMILTFDFENKITFIIKYSINFMRIQRSPDENRIMNTEFLNSKTRGKNTYLLARPLP